MNKTIQETENLLQQKKLDLKLRNAKIYKYNYKLADMYLFRLLQKYNMDICYRCKQKMDSYEEISVEHINPWYNIDPKLFWESSNLTVTHLHCNCAAARQGKGKLDYFGISEEKSKVDKNKILSYKAYCMTKWGQNKSLCQFKTQEEAAICRDLGTMYYQEGKGKLNFEQFRDQYKTEVKHYLDSNREIFYKNGPIKDLVYKFRKLLLENPK